MRPQPQHYINAGRPRRDLEKRGELEKSGIDLDNWLTNLLLLGPAVGAGAGYLHTRIDQPGKADWQRLRNLEMINTYTRLAEQAEQRARQMMGRPD